MACLMNSEHASHVQQQNMIRVAIAGTGGLAQYLSHYISTQTYHQFILLSRQANPGLQAKGYQVIPVNYGSQEDLRYQLNGVDVVISTISGNPQLALIDAAASVHVRRFVPSEFEGSPGLRPVGDVLDRGKRAALDRLQQYQQYGMEYAVFSCGIFYERFAPLGMASLNIGIGSGVAGEGDYLMDVRRMKASVPHYNEAGNVVCICLTSAQDVARFVVAALDLPTWPTELRMRGDRLSVVDVVQEAETMRGQYFEKAFYTQESMQDALIYAQASGDQVEQLRVHTLVATAASRYDFANPNLNALVADRVVPTRFRDWLRNAWDAPP